MIDEIIEQMKGMTFTEQDLHKILLFIIPRIKS